MALIARKTTGSPKARSEANRDAVDSIVMLLPADPSTGWFHEHVMAAELVCFYGPGRVSFQGEDRNPSIGLIIAVYGDDAGRYKDVLNSLGAVIEGREVYQPTVDSVLSAFK